MSWRAQSGPSALGALVTLLLAVLLAAGQAPYDWAWSRGQHASPAQWRAHERYEQRGVAHHGPGGGAEGADARASQVGTWLVDGTHEAHPAAPDGVQARIDSATVPRPGGGWRRLSPLPIAVPGAPPVAPPIHPPR